MKQKVGQHMVRIPPQDIDAEKALLGSIMVRPIGVHDIMDVIRPETFYVEKHGMIYKEMLDLINKGEPIDLVSMTTKLRERKVLETIGGVDYLQEIVAMVPASTNIGHYADIVSKKSSLRNLISAGDDVSEMGYMEGEEIEEVLDQAEKKILDVTNNAGRVKKFVTARDILPETYETIQRLADNKHELRGVPSGYKKLDDMLGGFQKSDLVILAARPSMGKTSLAMDIARKAAMIHNVPVGIFSLEMSALSLMDRMLSSEANVDSWKMRTGNLREQDWLDLTDAMSRLQKAPILIDDQPGNSILKMRSTARRMKMEHGLGMIIIDYLQLITTTKNFDSMVNQVTEISRSLKGLARELNVPVIALSQLNRSVETRGGRPRLSDLRDSGSIEQDADVVMFIHRDKEDQSQLAEILIEKHRNGPTGMVELVFDGSKTTFIEVEKRDFSDFAPAASAAGGSGFVEDNF
ncbi:MAG TPA: replicative DNA helicase [Candidatus Paceibacterota bacterium]|nr:replicative DNA helicase [Candidatus Paceibacterota bacterium]